jgi:hypothetical protein
LYEPTAYNRLEEHQEKEPTATAGSKSTSHVHVGAAPLLQSNNTEISAGIGSSLLDVLLPTDGATGEAPTKGPWNTLVGKGGEGTDATTAFEQFRKQAMAKEQRKKLLKVEEDSRKKQREMAMQQQGHDGYLGQPPATENVPSLSAKKEEDSSQRQEEIVRMRELEKERRRREAAGVDLTSQRELMANFEDIF